MMLHEMNSRPGKWECVKIINQNIIPNYFYLSTYMEALGGANCGQIIRLSLKLLFSLQYKGGVDKCDSLYGLRPRLCS